MKNANTLVKYMQKEPRRQNIYEIVNNITEAQLNQPLVEQGRMLSEADFPKNEMLPIGALIANVVSLCMPEWLAYPYYALVVYFIPDQDISDFLYNDYLPAAYESTNNVDIPFWDRVDLLRKFLGVLMKFAMAMPFQEQFFRPWLFDTDLVIGLGGLAIPFENLLIEFLTGY
jgi:hypothetical protein